jgi:teichuronic acid biosynthesis glycosyltransferase TuaC
MNIMLYVNSFLPLLGGREIVVHYLARELQRAGHRVRVVGPSGWWRDRDLHFDYPVHRWPTLRRHLPDQINYAQLALDQLLWGADVIHAHSTYPNGYAAAQLRRFQNTPLVVTPHGEDIHVIPEIGFGLRLQPKYDTKIKKSLHSANLVTSISSSVTSSLMDAGVNEGKIRLIPNGIDVERFGGASHCSREKLGLGSRSPLILSVGRYHPRKGFDFLLQSMPHVLKKIPTAQLVIVGNSRGKLEPQVESMGLGDSVRIAGEIPFPAGHFSASESKPADDLLADLYKASDIYVSAAMEERAEGLSLAMLDGMAAGLPIVATSISGNKDLVVPGRNGLLVPPAEPEALAGAIIDTLTNPQRSARWGQNNRLVAQQYSWTSVARQYLDIYREAIALAKQRRKRRSATH